MAATVAGATLTLAVPAGAARADEPGTAVRSQQGYVLRVEKAERPSAGVVRLTVVLENRGDSGTTMTALTGVNPWGRGPAGFDGLRVSEAGTARTGRPLMEGTSCVCTRMSAPSPGQAVRGTVDVADPGGERVDVFPTGGQPILGLPVTGAPSPAATLDDVTTRTVEALTRTRAAAATVSTGASVRVDLDTTVLFALDSATLTPKAAATLDAAAKALQAQSGRRIGVYGHTDSQGSDAHNLTLSQQRAAAVRTALAARLGSGWTFEVKGLGETSPLVPESGDTAAVREAQAANRRVELRVL